MADQQEKRRNGVEILFSVAPFLLLIRFLRALRCLSRFHSTRSATIGSMRVARLAGMAAATTPERRSAAIATR
jgi:hypothetical protein